MKCSPRQSNISKIFPGSMPPDPPTSLSLHCPNAPLLATRLQMVLNHVSCLRFWVFGHRFPGLRFPDTHLNCEDAPYSGADESKCLGDHKWQLKCLPEGLSQLNKELYNSPLSLEEKLISNILSSVKHSSGSYESASETSVQTVAQCQDKLKKLFSSMCSYRISGPTSIPKSFLRAFVKLCSNSVHFKKRRSTEQAFSRCQEVKNTTLEMQSEP